MNNQLPVEGQKVQVKLKGSDWQDAVYRDQNFVDLYGLPLGFTKITEWRTAARTSAPGRVKDSLSIAGGLRVG